MRKMLAIAILLAGSTGAAFAMSCTFKCKHCSFGPNGTVHCFDCTVVCEQQEN